ncbi:outer membrane protein [Alsobacter sp. R-9]
MKKTALAAALVAGLLSTSAFAADLPSRKVAPAAPVAYAPAFTWTGFYLGLNAGYGWGNGNDVTITGGGTTSTFTAGDEGGFVGGAQAGYNFQTGQFVFGVETDIQYADLGGSRTFLPSGVTTDSGSYFGTVRGRLGFAADRALFYVTGGLAYGDVGERVFGGSDTRAGWVVGGGVEYAFTNNWTAKVEGLYVSIDKGNSAGVITTGGVAYTATQSTDNAFGVVRAGVNYKF